MDGAVGVDAAGFLGEHGLGIVGGHAQERDGPHPEDGAGSADQDGAAGADDVAGSDLRGDGGCERLERAHAALMLAAVEREIAEDALQAFAEAAYLHEARFDGEEKTGADK